MFHVKRQKKNMEQRMVTMDIYGMQGPLVDVTLRQANLTENIICTKLTLIYG